MEAWPDPPEEPAMTEDGFLQAILESPKADVSPLVYADWLDEQGDPVSAAKAEFLRLTVQPQPGTGKKRWRKGRAARLQELAANLDTAWLAVVSRLPIENCQARRAEEKAAR